ncbi:MAG TPA: DUF1963 domain-containing protein [Stellaceae bacterium]|nr:DUF1963 domain-containing protein [Stellaceae bacterium]
MQPELQALIDQIAALTTELESVGHTGRYNRRFARRTRVFDLIDAHWKRDEALEAMLGHHEAEIRLLTAWHCGWQQVLLDSAERTIAALAERRDEIGQGARRWFEMRPQMAQGLTRHEPPRIALSYRPKPPGCTAEAAAALIDHAFPGEKAAAIRSLRRRAIGLWPRAADPTRPGSSLGGLPWVPPRWAWPFNDTYEEPLLFLAQIDCAAVAAAAGANPLPDHGLLLFFGDHDDVHGCSPTGAFSIQHVADASRVEPASVPSEAPMLFPRCDLDIYTTIELPDARSRAIERLGLSEAELATYGALRDRLASHGAVVDEDDCHPSKLFGWPDLVQDDLNWETYGSERVESDEQLLLQIGWYHDGSESQGWDPGGNVYFTLEERWLSARRFDCASIEMQCT